MYLLDTMVVSETFKPVPHPATLRWLEATRIDQHHLSVVTFVELRRGLGKAERGSELFARRLATWIAGLERRYGPRIVPVDLRCATLWGALWQRLGHNSADLIIAATALVHDLTVVTRNVRHFERTGVRTLDPYAEPA